MLNKKWAWTKWSADSKMRTLLIGERSMMSLFGRLMKSEKAVKAIFDHYKNFAVAAVIVAIGVRVYNTEQTGLLWWGPYASGVSLIAIGAFLLVLNERHGMHLLKNANLPVFQHLMILVIYGLSTIVLAAELISSNFRSIS